MNSNHAQAVGSAVPDVLAPNLRVVFCGINPGFVSAAAGAHFANPRNDFWRLLHDAGFTPGLLTPEEQFEVMKFGIGLTNAAARTTRGSGDLRRADFRGSAERLSKLAAELRPGWLAFVGKEAYRGTFGERPELGEQSRSLGRHGCSSSPRPRRRTRRCRMWSGCAGSAGYESQSIDERCDAPNGGPQGRRSIQRRPAPRRSCQAAASSRAPREPPESGGELVEWGRDRLSEANVAAARVRYFPAVDVHLHLARAFLPPRRSGSAQ